MDIVNSFTSSSSQMPLWRHFVVILFVAIVGLAVLCFSFVVLIDPYDSVSFSPDFERVQVDGAQRLFYPALAKSSRFDSAVFGRSNVRLLKPEILNERVGGNWVNLALNAASSWEQEKIFNVFVEAHDTVGSVLIGIDNVWCHDKYANEHFVRDDGEVDFPAWLYDGDTSNNLPPLNLASLTHASRQALTALGLRSSKYGSDGYTNFLPPDSEYDLGNARQKIYGSKKPKKIKPIRKPFQLNAAEREALPISALGRLQTMLDNLPADTRKILLFVPYHSYYQDRPGSRKKIIWDECRRRITNIAAQHASAYVLDFMIHSDITREDSNYWDHTHYTVSIGEQLSTLIGTAINEGQVGDNYRILYSTP